MKYEPSKTEDRNKYLKIQSNDLYSNIGNCAQEDCLDYKLNYIKTKGHKTPIFSS